ncbi:MFS transporter [Roseinatronobacter alkalisoli]|uniref:MFS transporter n=1 Tax=Roseinatronobacter alkalisoli TaxID=3028235 RepID=A0ABT5T7Y6_9RHOB|nr:MFS transporter [Roseinatronobacter sp. HJB301]MDD7971059.1 MFS transporter [Roseinatronobacter sp. HJB301]
MFLRQNLRWLSAGFVLTFVSAFGQTWFISLFAGVIKAEHALTDGSWGSLYTLATLGAAALMFWRGSLADTVALSRLAPVIALIFALAALAMALANTVWVLAAALFLLRFCGQGMFSHMAMTAMGRWFEANRGKAVSIANLGHSAGEVVVPLVTVLAIGAIGWRLSWIGVALLISLGIAPLLWVLLRNDRSPRGQRQGTMLAGLHGRQWTRQEAARHWLLPALLPVLLTPGFIGTVVFFHQVHIAEVKGWSLVSMAPGYSAFAATTVIAALVAGWAADRFGAQRLLPVLLLPTGFGIFVIGPAEQVVAWYVALGLIGMTQGIASALWGTLLPAVYGTRNLGAIRSLATTIMVVSTAIGPGITGILIDQGMNFPAQSLMMGAWCMGLAGACFLIDRRLTRELS